MPWSQLEHLRVPAAMILMLIAGFVFWPRAAAGPAPAVATPSDSVVVGQPGGEAVPATPTPAPTPIPTATLAPTPSPSTAPTTPVPAADGFTAEVFACRSIVRGSCNDPIDQLTPSVGTFMALIRFTGATVGDQMNAVLTGPTGTIAGTPYALQGNGDGYFWAEFRVGGLPAGDYVLTAVRNDETVGSTGFTKVEG